MTNNNPIEDFFSGESSEKKSPEKKVKYDFLQDAEDAEISAEIDYDALLHLEKKDFSKEKRDDFGEEKDAIIFYCRDCKSEQEVTRLGSSAEGKEKGKRKKAEPKIQFECNACKNKNIFYGTKRGIKEYFERKNS
jgi:hypothetical protein